MVRSSAPDWAKQPGTAAPAAGGEHRLFDMLVHRGRTTSGLCTRSAKLCIFYAQVKSSLILRMFSVPHQDLIRRHRAFWSPCFNWQQVQDDPLKLGTVAKVQMPHLKLVYQKSARKHSIFWLSAFTFKREHASPFLLHLLINKKIFTDSCNQAPFVYKGTLHSPKGKNMWPHLVITAYNLWVEDFMGL